MIINKNMLLKGVPIWHPLYDPIFKNQNDDLLKVLVYRKFAGFDWVIIMVW